MPGNTINNWEYHIWCWQAPNWTSNISLRPDLTPETITTVAVDAWKSLKAPTLGLGITYGYPSYPSTQITQINHLPMGTRGYFTYIIWMITQ